MAGKTYLQWQEEYLKEEGKILRKLKPLQKLIQSQQIEHKKIETAIARLSKPRQPESILRDFANANINAMIRRRFAQAETSVLDTVIDKIGPTIGEAINDLHKELPGKLQSWMGNGSNGKDPAQSWFQDQSAKIQEAQERLDNLIEALEKGKRSLRIGSSELAHRLSVINILSDTEMRDIIAEELDKLEELQSALISSQKTREELDQLIQGETRKLETLKNKIARDKSKAEALQKELEPVESALYITEEKYLSKHTSVQPVLAAARPARSGATTKKWCFVAVDIYDAPNGKKLEKIPNHVPIPQRAAVELTGQHQNIDEILWSEIIYEYSEYSKNEKKWIDATVTGWVNAIFLDDYNERYSEPEVDIPGQTDDPNDAKQYMLLDADFDGKLDPDTKYNMCGELCVAYIVKYEIDPESNIETVLTKWKKDGKGYSAKTVKEGTSASDLKNILQSYDKYRDDPDPDLIVDFKTGLKDGSLSYEGMKDKLKTHYLIALITIDGSGALIPKSHPKTLHWVIVEKFTKNGNRLEVYNPFPNKREEYSLSEFAASCRPSRAGLWVKRNKAIEAEPYQRPSKPTGQVELDDPQPEGYKAAQYIIREGEKKTNLCGEFCVAYIVGKSIDRVMDHWQFPPSGVWELVNILKAYGFRKKEDKNKSALKTFSIGAMLDHWRDTQPSLYEYHVAKNKPTGTRELRSILRAYGYSKDDFEEFNDGLTDKSAGYLPSPARMKKKLETHFLIAGVGIDGSSGKLITGPKGVRHWEVLEKFEPVGKHYVDKHFGGNGGWVELYNPFTNIMEEYSYREFTDSMSETGLWAGLWVKRNVNPTFEPQEVLPAVEEEKGKKGGRKPKGVVPVKKWPEQKLLAEISKMIKHGTPPEKIPNLLIKEGTGWSAQEIIKRLPATKQASFKMTAELEASICKRLGVDSLSPEIIEWIAEKSNGEPVFAVDLACALRDSGILDVKDRKGIVRVEFDAPELLDTFKSVITSRFVDTSKPASQTTLKIARTIGFAFSIQAAEDIKKIQAKQYLEAKKAAFLKNRPEPKMALLPIREFAAWTDELAAADDSLWKVRIWGDPKLGLTVESEAVKEKAPSNFQAVGLYNEVTARGAVSNFITIEREDIDMLMALQIEDEFEEKETDWLKQKMNWLCKEKGTIYFTKDTGHHWETGPSIFWGTLALGGNLVRVEGEPITMAFPGAGDPIEVVKLAGFRKEDWYRPLDELLAVGLVHRCFCAYPGNPPDRPVDSPKGIVYSPFFSLPDWRFGEGGNKKPRALYIPIRQLVKPVKNADGKVYERILEISGAKDKEDTVYKGIVEKLKEFE